MFITENAAIVTYLGIEGWWNFPLIDATASKKSKERCAPPKSSCTCGSHCLNPILNCLMICCAGSKVSICINPFSKTYVHVWIRSSDRLFIHSFSQLDAPCSLVFLSCVRSFTHSKVMIFFLQTQTVLEANVEHGVRRCHLVLLITQVVLILA